MNKNFEIKQMLNELDDCMMQMISAFEDLKKIVCSQCLSLV
ncbi:hypothetical protein [Paenibacillus sp. 8b26]